MIAGRTEFDERVRNAGHDPTARVYEFSPKCHPDAGMRAGYTGGVLLLACRECGERVAVIAVATLN